MKKGGKMNKLKSCPKSSNPYTYCPLAFKYADDMILSYCSSLVVEIRRANGLPMQISGDDAKAIDRYCGEITAYMNGRIHQGLNQIKEIYATRMV